MTQCFVRGCKRAVVGTSKTLGDGCQEHLERWRKSSWRTRVKFQISDFLRMVNREQDTENERAKALALAQAAAEEADARAKAQAERKRRKKEDPDAV